MKPIQVQSPCGPVATVGEDDEMPVFAWGCAPKAPASEGARAAARGLTIAMAYGHSGGVCQAVGVWPC